MERLTERIETGQVYTPYCDNAGCDENCTWCDFEDKILEKLADYEDAEEQGLLLRLPCKVGEDVWCLEDDECYGYVFIAMSGEYYIVSSNYVHCDDIYEQLEEMEDDTENGFEPSVCVYHKDKVFLTKEEAEQALAKMKEV